MKISRLAIDGKAPHSDLCISPEHAIYINGVLIPASNLVNGVTIVADAKPETLSLTLFHIELDTHEAILAEGLAVESFRHDDPHAQHSTMQTSTSGCTAHLESLRHPLRRQELASHTRSALAPAYDFRKPIEKVLDRIIDRLEFARAAIDGLW